jgi:ribosomal protein S18 acetylase RimI-like enzyme
MDIRPARLDDVPRIAQIHVRSWQAAYQGLMPQDYLDGLEPAQRIGQWTQFLSGTDWSRSGMLVADTDGDLTGFVNYGPARDDDADQQRVGEIRAIYLRPAAFGQGTGRQLMAAALKRLAAAGYDQATLWVLGTNDRARRFYQAGGWVTDGAVTTGDSFGTPLTEVRYRRSLP